MERVRSLVLTSIVQISILILSLCLTPILVPFLVRTSCFKLSHMHNLYVDLLNCALLIFLFLLQKVSESFLSRLVDVEKFLNEYVSLRTTAHLRKVKVEKLEEIVRQPTRPQATSSALNNFTPAIPSRAAPYPPAMGPGNQGLGVPPYPQMTPNSWGTQMPYPPANGSYALPAGLPRWVHLPVHERYLWHWIEIEISTSSKFILDVTRSVKFWFLHTVIYLLLLLMLKITEDIYFKELILSGSFFVIAW